MKPTVSTQLDRMNGLQRIVESFRYVALSIEWWMSPDGRLQEWLRQNLLLGTFLMIPAVFVMPVIGFILYQLTGWVSMLTGKSTVLPVVLIAVLILVRMTKR